MPHTVLCVDDEANVLNALTRLLHREPYALLTAAGGPEALTILASRPVSLIVADQRMSDMTGVQLLQQVKASSPDTVRVILSGYADAGLIQEALNRGEVFRFLTKPWDDEELKLAIRQCLTHHDLVSRNRLLTGVLGSLPLPVMAVDPTGRTLLANPAAEAAFPGTCRNGLGTALGVAVTVFLEGGPAATLLEAVLDGKPVRLHLRKLPGDAAGGACTLLVEETA